MDISVTQLYIQISDKRHTDISLCSIEYQCLKKSAILIRANNSLLFWQQHIVGYCWTRYNLWLANQYGFCLSDFHTLICSATPYNWGKVGSEPPIWPLCYLLLDPIGSQCIREIMTYLCFFVCFFVLSPKSPRSTKITPSEAKWSQVNPS